jgi:hypothetical protein
MSINKLYFSHQMYKFDRQELKLLNYKNCQEIIKSDEVNDYCTSISDLGARNISLAIKNSKEIIVIDIDFTNFTFDVGRLLNELSKPGISVKFVNCKKIDTQKINKLKEKRLNNDPVLWVAGCSITAGYGVNESNRYGKLLADKLNLPEVLLAKDGSSILYSADQLLRSDIRSNDIVVWGLTNIPRVEIFDTDTTDFRSVAITGYDSIDKSLQYWNLNYFHSSTQSLLYIRMILQVINFCKKVGAKLYLANMLDITWFPIIFKETHNFIDFVKEVDLTCSTTFIDLGTDNQHPGPKQHQYYAEQIFNIIKEKNYGKTI